MSEETRGRDMIEKLKTDRPDVVITVSRSRDMSFRWDGDGPDPEEEGFSAYDVDVRAVTIRNGVMCEGIASLGGSYFQDDEPIGEIHGYLPQMIEEALNEMDADVAAKETA